MNMKGGVGKTTVAMHVGGMLARYEIGGRRRKVLLIDYDPQFNLSQAFIPAKQYFALEKARKTTLAILLDDDTNLDPYHIQVAGNLKPPAVAALVHPIYSTHNTQLDLVASTLDLMYVALSELGLKLATVEERFQHFIDECRLLYDVIIIDCHPAGSVFTKTALRGSDHVLIPVVPQAYAVRGIGLMTQFINAKKTGQQAPTAHILFNRTHRYWISDEEASIRAIKSFKPLCLDSTLKWYRAFTDPEEGEGFVWSSKKPWSTQAFHNLEAVCTDIVKDLKIK
jgi:chromosome partitioning protein